ncbi:hypothetical protein BGZ60DRAFT_528121 [Tricladium varicosporioides]|nr:hypothetical protein BGZ60DRAFT_528121 [Hymenoscyphus varicosporioides]
MPSWIEITTWAFAAIGFFNTIRTLITNYAPNTRVVEGVHGEEAGGDREYFGGAPTPK